MARRSRPESPRVRPRLERLEAKQLLTTFTVTNVADSGLGSLRQAILDLNAGSTANDTTSTDADTIAFAIPGDGTHTIAPLTPLPAITRAADINATTQPGYAGTPLVVLDGLQAVAADGSPVIGLNFTLSVGMPPGTAQGLEVVRFSGTAIQEFASNSVLANDLIGTDASGSMGLGNGGFGVVYGGYDSYLIRDTVIADNGLKAIVAYAPEGEPPSTNGTLQNVTQTNNDTKATQITVALASGTAHQSPNWGSQVTETYTVTNTGSVAATDVDLVLRQIDAAFESSIVSASSTQGTTSTDFTLDYANKLPVAQLGTLAPGASATVKVVIQLPDYPGPNSIGLNGDLEAYATSPQLDYFPEYAPTQTTLTPVPVGFAPNLAGSSPDGPRSDSYAAWGGTTTLTYTVTNTGPDPITGVDVTLNQLNLHNPSIVNPAPPLLSVASVTTTQGTTTIAPDELGDYHGLVHVATLAPGASAVITIQVQVAPQGDNPDQTVVFDAQASDDAGFALATTMTQYFVTLNETGQPPAPGPVTIVGPTTTTTVSINPGVPITTPTSSPGGVVPSVPASPADLVVAGTAPVAPQVGVASLFQFTVRNAGGTTAGDAIAALDLRGFAPGSFYAIESLNAAGRSGTLTPIAGRPGVYLVDLGTLTAGASAQVAVLVVPSASGPISMVIAASDATTSAADPTSVNNVLYASSAVAAATTSMTMPTPTATPTISGTITSPSVVQVQLPSAVTRAEAQDLAHYQLSTTTGTSTAMVKIRSARYVAATHQITLRLVHPVPVTAQARLTMSGLGLADGSSTTLGLTWS